ncbi:hypothetical protein ACSHUI_00555 [Bacillus subtilis]|uniref:hypothetical protein n=1 Tax=Bacillus subtilis TaxID=1423 RepID=UPI003CF2C667
MSEFNRAYALPLFNTNKVALVKRVRELEERGFECVIPIKKMKMYQSVFKEGIRYYDSRGVVEAGQEYREGWGTKMRFKPCKGETR